MKDFLKFPLIILIAGILLVVVIFLVSLTPIFSPFEPVENIQDAKEVTEEYLKANYQLLEVKEVMEFSNNFYVIARETDSQNSVFELLIDKNSGRVYQEPGPNMMWNTKYGHHNRWDNPTNQMPVNAENAVMIAQDWLNNNFFGK